MKCDFDNILNRRNSNCEKWDLYDDEIPMWVADMDFKVAPKVYEAVNKRAQHAIYGYPIVPDSYFDAFIKWWKKYGIDLKRDEMLFSVSVMPAITSTMRIFTNAGDKVLIQTPAYYEFFDVIKNNEREVLENELVYNENADDVESAYTIDYDDLEEKLSFKDTKVMILCNPHNPIGKIWRKDDLKKIADLCKRHDVILISDEIHCDLVDPGETYSPLTSVSDYENIFTCISPSKTFNIAGLKSSVIFTKNKKNHAKLKKQLQADLFSQANVFSVDATIAAYECEKWAEELKEYIFENKMMVNDFLKENIPEIKLVPSNATYLLWLDCSKLNSNSTEISNFLRREVGLFLAPGIEFGQCGDNFLRLNIGCPKEILKEGLNALKEGIELFLNNS